MPNKTSIITATARVKVNEEHKISTAMYANLFDRWQHTREPICKPLMVNSN